MPLPWAEHALGLSVWLASGKVPCLVQHEGGTLSWMCNALQGEGLPQDVSGLLEAVEQDCSQAGLHLPSDWQVLKDMIAEHWRTLLAETMPAWVQVGTRPHKICSSLVCVAASQGCALTDQWGPYLIGCGSSSGCSLVCAARLQDMPAGVQVGPKSPGFTAAMYTLWSALRPCRTELFTDQCGHQWGPYLTDCGSSTCNLLHVASLQDLSCQ